MQLAIAHVQKFRWRFLRRSVHQITLLQRELEKKLKEPLYEPVGVPFLVYLPTSWWVLMLCAVVYDIFRKTDITSVLKYITQLTFFILFDYSSFLQIFMQIYKSTN